MRLHVILRHALAVGVHQAEVVLRFGKPLVSSLAVPANGGVEIILLL